MAAFWVMTPYGLIGGYQPIWRWRSYVPPKRWYQHRNPRGVTTQKASDFFIWIQFIWRKPWRRTGVFASNVIWQFAPALCELLHVLCLQDAATAAGQVGTGHCWLLPSPPVPTSSPPQRGLSHSERRGTQSCSGLNGQHPSQDYVNATPQQQVHLPRFYCHHHRFYVFISIYFFHY